MKCTNCDNSIKNEVGFCDKCGHKVVQNQSHITQNCIEDKKWSPEFTEKIKEIFKVIAIIFFVGSISTINQNNAVGNTLLKDTFTIINGIVFLMLVGTWWENRKKNKKWFGWRWIIFLILLSALSLGNAIFSESITVAYEKASITANTWATYSAPESNFSAQFPSKPVHTTQNLKNLKGITRVDTYKQADHTASVLYVINVSRFSPNTNLSDYSIFLKNTVTISAKNGTVLSSDRTTVNGYPAISYSIEFNNSNKPSIIKGLNILVGHRLYQLLTVYDKSKASLLEYNKFVDSFRIQ